MRSMVFEDGVLIEDNDQRTVSWCVAQRLDMVRNECALAIDATGIRWMVEREVSGGKPVPRSVKDACAQLRAKSNALEAQINALAAGADDNDKSVCDAIETVSW